MRRGEVWLVTLDPTVGSEMGKTRPAVIVSKDAVGILPLKIIVPMTEWQEYFAELEWMVRVEPSRSNGLNKLSAADAFQLNSVSTERLIRQLGTVDETEMQAITLALALVMEIEL
ncbi:MAG: type II toxin-antitoxin system PemK/MazF family toxin [Hormoscilla sp.]